MRGTNSGLKLKVGRVSKRGLSLESIFLGGPRKNIPHSLFDFRFVFHITAWIFGSFVRPTKTTEKISTVCVVGPAL